MWKGKQRAHDVVKRQARSSPEQRASSQMKLMNLDLWSEDLRGLDRMLKREGLVNHIRFRLS